MLVRRMRPLKSKEPWRLLGEERPLRAEPFSEDHLAVHARELAELLSCTLPGREDRRFLKRFAENAQFLRDSMAVIAAQVREGLALRPDAEWLLDNFYIVEEQLREIRDDLPRRYYHELPKTDFGEPRVYLLAVELVTHTDSVLNEETIVRFVTEFQTITPLSMGEVWAIPIMLRLVLIENLRRIAAQMLSGHASERRAAQIVETWQGQADLPLKLDPIEEHGSLLFHIIDKLQQDGAANIERIRQFERRLAGYDLTLHQCVHLEHQRQASSQVSIGNVITSMRLISAVDWVAFFERTNLTEQVLRRDPPGIYGRMDFESRDRYRHVIEDLAEDCPFSQTEVAEAAISLAQQAVKGPRPTDHVGYWLIDDGRDILESRVQYLPGIATRIARGLKKAPNLTYFGGLGIALIIALVIILEPLLTLPLWVCVIGLLALFPASELAVGLINTLVTSRMRPRILPKLDFSSGIPAEHRTVVVVPCLLSGPMEVETLLQRLETHYLANPDPVLSFALLTDFPDAPQADMPTDAALLEQAIDGIHELNKRHGSKDSGPFFLFHRTRRWNEQEQSWMGWERKRGKLMEFNHLLKWEAGTSFVIQQGNLSRLIPDEQENRIRYVITLDADTTMPHDAARKLVATIAHPLNVPLYDEAKDRVVSGYVILQPRVSVNLASAQNSRYAQLFANSPGLDPYATCASDVYQDLFGEGSFTGKGIYQIETFDRVLDDAFPLNQILSHDLIEGCHTRVALVSDIELFDSFPAKYEADAKRQHRWVRGDWQIALWLLPVVARLKGWGRNRLSLLSRWKILDNLRRSLVPPSLVAWLIIGWTLLPQFAWRFTIAAILVQIFPILAQLGLSIRNWPRNSIFLDQAGVVWKNLKRSTVQVLLMTAFLPQKAWLMLDAIGRTLFRILITRRRLLEWATASEVDRQLAAKSSRTVIHWLAVPSLAIMTGLSLTSAALPAAIPFLGLWFLSPLLSHWLDLRPKRRQDEISLSDQGFHRLRLHARRVWAFFEAYVGAKDHWLPPDNVQEYPEEKIAHRISPTNEGLFLISGMVARDFGYLSLHALVELWERNLAEWQQFPRLQGHFYNWYDTLTRDPLLPRYVSTVDSGNLLACLLTMERGIDELCKAPIAGSFLSMGLADTADMIVQTGDQMHLAEDRRVQATWTRFVSTLSRLRLPEFQFQNDPHEWDGLGERLQSVRTELANCIEPLAISLHGTNQTILVIVRLLLDWLASIRQELTSLFPWVEVLHERLVKELRPSGEACYEFQGLPVNEAFSDVCQQLWKTLAEARSLSSIADLGQTISPILNAFRSHIESLRQTNDVQFALDWVNKLSDAIGSAGLAANSLHERFQSLSREATDMAQAMDFRMLFNPQRKLFSIGFNLETNRLDSSHYDMLCSEARIASFLAIAKGDVESRHWFRLGRQMTQTAGHLSLLSWGGTMFEYQMPHLFQKAYEDSLLGQSLKAAVARQQEYGRQRGLPWGISECAFGALAANSDYHYRSFGVPGLGLKRGLSKDLVISPYSTMLALEIDPHGAVANLERLEQEGGLGVWGFYEALDFTPERVLAGKRSITVRCFMAHHQGMSLLALGNLLNDGATRRRFHEHPLVRATELLLQERTPASLPRLDPHVDEQTAVPISHLENEMVSRRILGVATAVPRLQLLSNGQYHVMLTSTGGGYSQFNGIGVTRWRSDATRDHWGQFLYLKDRQTGRVWSATYQPTCAEPSRYEAIYSIDKAEYFRRDGQIETQLEVAVSPENNAEMRQLRVTNNGRFSREIEITSYAEVSLVEPTADLSHMAFQKLFIETEFISDKAVLLAKRRPRDSRQAPVWAAHALSASPEVVATLQVETSRQKFLGRGRTPRNPQALEPGMDLSGTVGAVLDPVFSIRCKIDVPPDGSVTVAFTTFVAGSREEAITLADQYHDSRGVQRAFELAWAYSQVELRHLQLSPSKMHLYQRLASAMLYPDRGRRPTARRLKENHQGQRGLWRYGISGAVPMFVVYVTKPEQIELVRESLGAHLYWKGRGLKTEFVIVNDYPGSYFDAMQEQLNELLQELQIRLDDKPAEVFLLRGAQIPAEDKALLDAVASVILYGDRGTFGRQVETAVISRPQEQALEPPVVLSAGGRSDRPTSLRADGDLAPSAFRRFETTSITDLEYWNGTGGFAKNGREYHIRLTPSQTTAMPWSNVIANEQFGCVLTESGGGYTWFANSRENKLTTWANDPVTDTPSEALYLYDADSGEVFSPVRGLLRDSTEHWIQHGQGYSRFVHRSNDLSQDVTISIAPDDPVKFILVSLRNEQPHSRKLNVTYFAEWVLGVSREETQMHVATSVDQQTGALLATNFYHPEFPTQVAFLHVLWPECTVTGDRTEFLGRNGNLTRPAAVRAVRLSGRTGAGLDPCGAVQTNLRIAPRETIEVIFLLGAAADQSAASALLAKYNHPTAVHEACQATIARWNETLETIEVKTPDRAFDLIVNRWLLYQTLSCRVLGRSAYYQSGGAFGFRDQLQDVMAAVYSRPEITRRQILNAASRQFEEGDVQHWWHPPSGRGTRTRFSDDLLWLPFVVCHYLAVTGDDSILDEAITFVHSPPLEPHQQERYETPEITSQSASLYEHCRRAIDHGFRTGVHGLPLMGCGDWNDGMNKVGEEGRGESVWVGWFLLALLEPFLPIMRRRGDTDLAADWQIRQAALRNSLEANAWDGEWYRRAYFDDETPLGSAQNDECQIDSLAQTWAVIAGGDAKRSREAVESVMDRLVQWKAKLVLLFTPPFNTSLPDPGYIMGYVPGIRENGGQYTHSATWLIQALTILGDGNRAAQVFDLINPVNHTTTRDQTAVYQVEPYVISADVYGVPPHTGRGGWSWYTGSAAWLYRAAIEFILGFRLNGKNVRFASRIPDKWDGFEFRFGNGTGQWLFKIVREGSVQPPPQAGTSRITVDWGSTVSLDETNSGIEVLMVIPRPKTAESAVRPETQPSSTGSSPDLPSSSDSDPMLLASVRANGSGDNLVDEVAQ